VSVFEVIFLTSTQGSNEGIDHKAAFTMAAGNWKTSKHNPANGGDAKSPAKKSKTPPTSAANSSKKAKKPESSSSSGSDSDSD